MAKPTNAQLQTEIERLTAELEEHKAKLEESDPDRLAKLEAELEAGASALGDAMATLEKRNEAIEQLKATIEGHKDQGAELEEARAELELIREEAKRLEQAVEVEKEKAADREPTELEAELAKAKKELSNAKEQLNGRAHGPCCEAALSAMARGEGISAARTMKYRKRLALLNKVR